MLQLFINDELADLADDSPIALTFQINNLGEVKNQQGNTSNQFKLPLTQRNKHILGFPDSISLNTGALYNRYPAKIVQDGLEIIPYGIAEVNSVDGDTAAVTVLSGNVDFFDALGGKLYEMGDSTSQWTNNGKNLPWKKYDHVWNLTNVVSSQKKTDGWIYPVIDYGKFEDNKQTINVRQLRPGFYVKTVVDILMQTTGYKARGAVLESELYNSLICQFSNGSWEHGTDYQNAPDLLGVQASVPTDIYVYHPDINSNKGTINFNSVDKDESGQFSGNNTFTAKELMTIDIVIKIPELVFFGRKNDKHASILKFIIRTFKGSNVNIINETQFDLTQNFIRKEGTSGSKLSGTSVYKNVVISTETQLQAGDRIRIDYEFFGDRPASFTLLAGASLTISQQNKTVQFGQTVQCERILPDLSQKDFLKDVLQRFGIICQTNATDKTVTFSNLSEIVNNLQVAKNWTHICIDQGKQISYQLGNYAQVNHMLFENDDAIQAGFGHDHIDIKDASLPASAEMLKSPFAPTLNRKWIKGSIAQIKMIDSESDNDDFSISVAPRILVYEKRYITDDKPVTFEDGLGNKTIIKNDYVCTPYFYKLEGDHNLCFSDMPATIGSKPGIRSIYYPELEKVLQQTKKVIRHFLLTPRDIMELDLLIPVYLEQDSAYYYINKIDSWRKGQPTKVELIRL